MVTFQRTLYPFCGSYFDHPNGLQQHYLDEGKGDPLVMVHGNPTWSFFYRNLVLGLRDEYRTIVPDHIGCGFSDKPDDDRYAYTLESRVDDLEALLDNLGLRKNITLIAHDWGGMISMAYATRHPKRIKRIVMMNTGAFHLPASKPLPLALKICRDSSLGEFMVRGFNAFSRGALLSCTRRYWPLPVSLSREVQEGYLAPYNNWKNRIGVARFVQDIPLDEKDRAYKTVSNVQDNLAQFQSIPRMILWGEKDFVFDKHFLAEWERIWPDAPVHRFPKAGHYLLEDKGEECLALIKDFLKANPLKK